MIPTEGFKIELIAAALPYKSVEGQILIRLSQKIGSLHWDLPQLPLIPRQSFEETAATAAYNKSGVSGTVTSELDIYGNVQGNSESLNHIKIFGLCTEREDSVFTLSDEYVGQWFNEEDAIHELGEQIRPAIQVAKAEINESFEHSTISGNWDEE